MRLRIDDPALLPELIEFLESRIDMVIATHGRDEVELSLLGCYGVASARETVALLVRGWEEAGVGHARSAHLIH
jgi:hypothetical protein